MDTVDPKNIVMVLPYPSINGRSSLVLAVPFERYKANEVLIREENYYII